LDLIPVDALRQIGDHLHVAVTEANGAGIFARGPAFIAGSRAVSSIESGIEAVEMAVN